jgi:hypothetical protein
MVKLREADYTVDQDSGAVWSVFRDPKSLAGFTIVTAAGIELLRDPEESAIDLMRKYRSLELGKFALFRKGVDIREILGQGQEATVYTMGQDFAVREVRGIMSEAGAIGHLQRMDRINTIIENGLPRWLNLPVHYGLRVDTKTDKTYTLMERIDNGITVEDIQKYPNELPRGRSLLVRNEMGGYISDAKKKVPALYEKAYEVLAESLDKAGKEPTDYLTDWKPRNVLVQGHLRIPIAGSSYSLTVIDQYRD